MVKKRSKKPAGTTKKNLKTMSQNGSSYKIRTARRVVKYGTISFTRNIWLSIAATLVMTITLMILFVTVIASAILTSTADTMREKIDITIFFMPGTTNEQLEEMAVTMRADENVKDVEIADSNTEYARFLAENSDDNELMTTLKDKAMRDAIIGSMQATMRVKVHDTNDLSSIENIVNNDENFVSNLDAEKMPTYDVNRTEIETVTSWANIAKNGGLGLSIIFLIISILVIFNTIRMAIFSRREEIYMMRLVGADNSFIRGPFLVEAQMCGVISGVIASTVGFFAFHFLAPHLSNYGIDISMISNILESPLLILVYAIMILAGVIIGTISAFLAIHKYLNKN